jgi:hypothetical protein
MQLQQLVKNALIDAGLMDYAVDASEREMLRQGEELAFATVDALNNDPALSFGLDTIIIDNLDSMDIYFPLPEPEQLED